MAKPWENPNGPPEPGEMQIRLLGTVEVRLAGQWVGAGQPRQCGVLAALAMDAGRPVPVETLVDRVWDDQAPDRARDSLYVYIARLRRLLAAGSGPAQPVRRAGCYLLEVGAEQVDVHRFRALVERSRKPDLTDPERVGLLESALALWRGTPLSGVPGTWATRVRQFCTHQRLDASVEWARAHLRLGTAEPVVERLRELAVEHPLAEPLAVALMRALAATGQSSAALDHFAVVRQQLANELGADPGTELQQLHRALLRGEPDPALNAVAAPNPDPAPNHVAAPNPDPAPNHLAAPNPDPAPNHVAAPNAVAAQIRPAQLPPDGPAFSGRLPELARLGELLSSVDRQPTALVISAMSGGAGVGKTALAVHWAHRVAHRFPDGQLYLNLRGFHPSGQPITPAEAVGLFLDALGVPPQGVPVSQEARVGLYRSLLAGKRMLVVLDNARDAAQVRPLLPGSSGSLVLVTSRDQLTGLIASDGAHPLRVDAFTAEEAHAYLARRLGPDRIAAEPAPVREIVARCARLPLALAVVTARALANPRRSLRALAEELRDETGLQPFDGGGDQTTDLRAVFAGSYRALGVPARRMFRLLGLHTGTDITLAAAASLAGLPPDRARGLLAELSRANLLLDRSPGRYALHDLIRAYAGELVATVDPAPERGAARCRLFDHYRFTAYAAARIVSPNREPLALPPPPPEVTLTDLADLSEALAWFGAEQSSLVAAIHAEEPAAHTWVLAWALRDYLDIRSDWPVLLTIHRIALDSAIRVGDLTGQASVHNGIALAHARMDNLTDAHAHLQQALALVAQVKNHRELARLYGNIGYLHELQGNYAEALTYSQRAWGLHWAMAEPCDRAQLANVVGWHYALVGRYAEGLTHCDQALRWNRDLGSRRGEANNLDSLGYIHHHLGNHAQSAACFRDALRLFRDLGDRHLATVTLARLTKARGAAGDPAEGRAAWREAVGIYAQIASSTEPVPR